MRPAALNLWGGPRPLVSCLMVTQAKRWALGPPPGFKAFVVQTYEPRELVMVTKDACDAMVDAARAFHDCVRLFDVSDEPPGTLGELRQIAVDMAGGEFVATWDDDDVSAPARLAEQVRVLQPLQTADACVLARMRVDDLAGDRQFVAPYFEWEPTMVARRDALPAYPALDAGEDFEVMQQLRRVVLLDRPDLYTYRVHGGNAVAADRVERWHECRTGGAW